MVKLTIDQQEIEVSEGTTVLQAAQELGIEIPIFCYHRRLAIAGNCRMCLVEVKNSPKLIASCAMPAANGMEINTTTPTVQKARKGVLEFLLINHPLDCPICDQGGECDLQDITMAYGPSTSRFQENKRAVPDKYMGPLIKTFMNRCIHCTRCVRFATDVAGVREMGTLGRGENVEITSYLDRAITSELSGNLVDICPVGALTSRPYSYKGRPWDLIKTPSIDVMDALGSHISVETYGMKVIRILPRLCEEINEEWISDKTRHACDGLSRQRLDKPYVRKDGKLQPVSWQDAYQVIQNKIKFCQPHDIAALVGDMADCESMFALKELMHFLKSPHLDCRPQNSPLSPQNGYESYLFNSSISGIEQADACLVINTFIRQDAPLIHARLRKRYPAGHFKVAYLGGEIPKDHDFTFPYDHLGDKFNILSQLIDGSHPFSKFLENARKPMIIIGESAFANLNREDAATLQQLCFTLAQKFNIIREGWNGYNFLHRASARVGGLSLNFMPQENGFDTRKILEGCQQGSIKFMYLLGVDEINISDFGQAFVVYQGHHGDQGAHRADVILPGAAYTEKSATYVNTEGRIQETRAALAPPGDAQEDWKIIVKLGQVLGHSFAYQAIESLRDYMRQQNPVLLQKNILSTDFGTLPQTQKITKKELQTCFVNHDFNFYMTDPISRASITMANCVKELSPCDHKDTK